MLPLKDTIPSRSFPLVNWLLIGLNVLVFMFELSAAARHHTAARVGKSDDLEPLLLKSGVPQSVRNDMTTIRRNIEVQAHLIDELLDLGRFTSGKLSLQLRPADVHEQLRAVAGIWHNSFMHKRLSVQWDLHADQHWVNGDEARIQQVFWNLIGNAIKFTPKGGTICLRSYNDASGGLVIEVQDSGAGIKPELLSRIFSAFEQGEEGRRKGGLGLGLAICKAIVGLHHGTVSAQSEGEGCGATFKVELPAISEQPTGVAEPPVAQVRSSLRILLVEDHEDTGRVLRRLLEAEGHVVEHVTTGHAALNAAAAQSFDLLLCDVGLPDISGLDVMRQLRDQHSLKGIAISG